VLALTRSGQTPLAHGMTAMGNHSVTAQAPPSSAAKTNAPARTNSAANARPAASAAVTQVGADFAD